MGFGTTCSHIYGGLSYGPHFGRFLPRQSPHLGAAVTIFTWYRRLFSDEKKALMLLSDVRICGTDR